MAHHSVEFISVQRHDEFQGAEQGARANAGTCRVSARVRDLPPCSGRGSSLTFGKKVNLSTAHTFRNASVLSWRLSDALLEIDVSDVIFDGQSRGPAHVVLPLLKPSTAMVFDRGKWVEETTHEPLKEISALHFKLEKHYSLHGTGATTGRHIAIGLLSNEGEITW